MKSKPYSLKLQGTSAYHGDVVCGTATVVSWSREIDNIGTISQQPLTDDLREVLSLMRIKMTEIRRMLMK